MSKNVHPTQSSPPILPLLSHSKPTNHPSLSHRLPKLQGSKIPIATQCPNACICRPAAAAERTVIPPDPRVRRGPHPGPSSLPRFSLPLSPINLELGIVLKGAGTLFVDYWVFGRGNLNACSLGMDDCDDKRVSVPSLELVSQHSVRRTARKSK